MCTKYCKAGHIYLENVYIENIVQNTGIGRNAVRMHVTIQVLFEENEHLRN